MIAPTGLTFVGFYSMGDWDGYAHLRWTSPAQHPTTEPFYRVEARDAVALTWGWVADVPPGMGDKYGVGIKFATAPSGGTPRTRIIDQVRVTAIDATQVSPEAPAVSTALNTPSSLTEVVVAATNFQIVCHGEIGETTGAVDITWDDASMFVRNGRIILGKFGVTSPAVGRTLYDSTFTSTPSELGPNFIRIPLELFPPGINLNDSLDWDLFNPPSTDPRAPFWVVEGDLLTLGVELVLDSGASTGAVFTFEYHRAASMYPFVFRFHKFTGGVVPYTDWAYLGVPYSKNLRIVQDQFLPIVMTGSIAYVSGLPSSLTFDPTPNVWKISGSIDSTVPLGQYEVLFDITSEGNNTKRQSLFLDVGTPGTPGQWPIITSPSTPLVLLRGAPIDDVYTLTGSGTGGFAVASGTLPAGVTLETASGRLIGTPTTTEAAHDVGFHQWGGTTYGPTYIVNFTVIEGLAPTASISGILNAFLYELSSFRIASNFVADNFRTGFLPNGLSLLGGTITGVPDCPLGKYPTWVQAGNIFGWGPQLPISIIVDVNVPVITSPNSIDAIINEPFFYQIVATNEPSYFSADGLPDGLDYNPYTGVISGVPTGLSSAYHLTNPATFMTGDKQGFTLANTVSLSAVNRAGAGTMDLVLNVNSPAVPVIDTSALNGRAISLNVNDIFTFQPSASNNPTNWSAIPLPTGLSFDTTSGRLSGQFISSGFYGITFVASNAGGDSDPVTFYFLVGITALSNGTAPPALTRVPIDVVNLWVDLDTGFVSIDSSTQSDAKMTVKRGDTTVTNIIFHQLGIPQNISIAALYFGAKVTFDGDYVVYSTAFTRTTDGQYKTYPDFSDQNNELDSIMSTDQAELLGEVQWDLSDGTRRSTQTFGIVVLRDLLHPDPML